MKWCEQITSQQFNDFSDHHPLTSIFQHENWAKTKSNWQARYIGIKKEETIIAAGLCLLQKLPLGLHFAYMPKGPLLDYSDNDVVDFYFKQLKQFCRNNNIIYMKIDPPVIIKQVESSEKEEIPLLQSTITQRIEQVGIKHNGYTLSLKETIQPRIQLNFPLHREIPNKTMKKIRQCSNKQVIVKEELNSDSLVKMVECTKKRHHIQLRNKQYFDELMKSFNDRSIVLSAYQDDILLSSCLLVRSQKTVEILYSGYDDDYKNTNSTYLLRYKAIEWAKQQHCEEFNFGGVEGTLDDGLSMFKLSFNPLITVYIGEFNVFPYPIISQLFHIMYQKRKNK